MYALGTFRESGYDRTNRFRFVGAHTHNTTHTHTQYTPTNNLRCGLLCTLKHTCDIFGHYCSCSIRLSLSRALTANWMRGQIAVFRVFWSTPRARTRAMCRFPFIAAHMLLRFPHARGKCNGKTSTKLCGAICGWKSITTTHICVCVWASLLACRTC